VPDEIAGNPEAQHVYDLVTAIVEALFDSGARLIFGRHPTITPLVHTLAKGRTGAPPTIDLYQLQRFRGKAPPEASDSRVFQSIHWLGDAAADIAEDLDTLREAMIRPARAAVFVGGKTTGFRGRDPGIREEYRLFRARHSQAPIYLVGTAGGETARLIADAVADVAAGGEDWEKNGLRGEARHVLHASRDPRIVAALIARDLQRLC
jgi:hypothetical protein